MSKSGTYQNGLAFIADHHKDGWDQTQNKMNFAGDFTMPGSPHESWLVGYTKNGITTTRLQGRAGRWAGMSCTISDDTVSASGLLQATSVCSDNDVRVTQVISFGSNQLFFRTHVTVQALSSDLTDVRYMRNMDPDNDRNYGSGYRTANRIVAQYSTDSYCAVEANSAYSTDAYVAIVSTDQRCSVAHGGFHNRNPYSYSWNSLQSTGTANTADQAIDLLVKLDSMSSGSSKSFDWYYVFDRTIKDSLETSVEPAPCGSGS